MFKVDNLGAVIISLVATLAFVGVLILWVTKPPQVNSDVLNVLVGALTTGYVQTLNYWFGSSASSKQKDRTIASLSNTPSPPP